MEQEKMIELKAKITKLKNDCFAIERLIGFAKAFLKNIDKLADINDSIKPFIENIKKNVDISLLEKTVNNLDIETAKLDNERLELQKSSDFELMKKLENDIKSTKMPNSNGKTINSIDNYIEFFKKIDTESKKHINGESFTDRVDRIANAAPDTEICPGLLVKDYMNSAAKYMNDGRSPSTAIILGLLEAAGKKDKNILP